VIGSRTWLIVGACTLVSMLTAQAGDAAGDAITIGNHAQLFLDDWLIEKSENLKRTVHQPQVYSGNPLVDCDKPWEFSCVTLWGTVLYDEQDQLFKMWYQTWGDNAPPDPRRTTFVCYATGKTVAHTMLSGDRVDHRMTLTDIGGKAVRLKFVLKNAELYSFRVK
jgi:hypothetical protein